MPKTQDDIHNAFQTPSQDRDDTDRTRNVIEDDLTDKRKRFKRKMDRRFKRNMKILQVMFLMIAPLHGVFGPLVSSLTYITKDTPIELQALPYILYGSGLVYVITGIFLKNNPSAIFISPLSPSQHQQL